MNIEEETLSLLSDLNIDKSKKIDPTIIVEKLGGEVLYVKRYDDFKRASNMLCEGDNKWCIVLTIPHYDPMAAKFFIAKEICHYIFGSNRGQNKYYSYRDNKDKSLIDVRFALYLLMPTKELTEQLKISDSMQSLRVRFMVSEMTVKNRLALLNNKMKSSL